MSSRRLAPPRCRRPPAPASRARSSAFQSLADTISTLSGSISKLQTQVDQQVSSSIGTINTAIKQIYTLNSRSRRRPRRRHRLGPARSARSGIQKLSQHDRRAHRRGANGQLVVSTQDGVQLVGDTYAQLSYAGGASNGTYGPIMLDNVNPATGQTFGQSTALDPHLGSGKLKGLIDMRDGALSDLQAGTGSLRAPDRQQPSTRSTMPTRPFRRRRHWTGATPACCRADALALPARPPSPSPMPPAIWSAASMSISRPARCRSMAARPPVSGHSRRIRDRPQHRARRAMARPASLPASSRSAASGTNGIVVAGRSGHAGSRAAARASRNSSVSTICSGPRPRRSWRPGCPPAMRAALLPAAR